MSNDRKTNTELVDDLMSYSRFGAMAQVFIIEAIRSYSSRIVENGEPEDNKSLFISPVLWYNIAKDVLDRVEQNYKTEVK